MSEGLFGGDHRRAATDSVFPTLRLDSVDAAGLFLGHGGCSPLHTKPRQHVQILELPSSRGGAKGGIGMAVARSPGRGGWGWTTRAREPPPLLPKPVPPSSFPLPPPLPRNWTLRESAKNHDERLAINSTRLLALDSEHALRKAQTAAAFSLSLGTPLHRARSLPEIVNLDGLQQQQQQQQATAASPPLDRGVRRVALRAKLAGPVDRPPRSPPSFPPQGPQPRDPAANARARCMHACTQNDWLAELEHGQVFRIGASFR